MRNKTEKQFKKGMALALVGIFFTSACATTNYVPKQSGVIKIMFKGYQKDNQFFKGGLAKGGLVKVVESNEEALHSAKRSSKNAKWALGLIWGGAAMVLGGSFSADVNEPDSATRNVVGNTLIGTGFASMLLGIIPALKSRASESDAINKYNDDVLQRLAPQVFTAPVSETKPKETKQESKKGLESSVITVQQTGELENE